jgi:hypothetical protein
MILRLRHAVVHGSLWACLGLTIFPAACLLASNEADRDTTRAGFCFESMTDQEINIAIAEACGYVWVHSPKSYIEIDKAGQLYPKERTEVLHPGWVHGKNPAYPMVYHQSWVPNYCRDLNAMHEAETTITDASRYRDALMDAAFGANKTRVLFVAWWNADARQRAEAFLKVTGLWKKP